MNILPQKDGYGLILGYSHQTDSLALVKIYTVADGANWKESRRWDLNKPMKEWPGVKLNDDGRVIECSITNGTVTSVEWELPAEIATLTELQIFQAVGSKVKGDFPDFLYDLTKLTKLVVNGNNITGSLSAKVANWTELTNLYVNNNKQFGGTLPVELGTLKKLQNLNIAQTAIGGAVPAELSGCEALSAFMAYETAFTSIPDNWDQWPALKIIQLYGCEQLECPLPASIGNMKKVTSLQLKNGCFTGNIPESYANLPTTCTQLYVNGNKLQGVVPAAVQAHANWTAKWKPEVNILPQKDGYGLTLGEVSLDGRWEALRYEDNPDDVAFVAMFTGPILEIYIIAWGQHYIGEYTYANDVITYNITSAYQAYTDVTFDGDGKMISWSWEAGHLDAATFNLAEGYNWYTMNAEDLEEYKSRLKQFDFKVTGDTAQTSLFGLNPVFKKKN